MDQQKPVKLAYACVEPESGSSNDLTPIILHHGLTSCKDRWKPLMQTLANKTNRKIYAVDARNHGESERSDFFNFTILAKDLENFLEMMNISKAIIIGHSVGGMVAISMALTVPQRVETIIVEDMTPGELKPELHYVLTEMVKEQMTCLEQVSSEDTEANVQQQLRECIYRTIPMIPDEDREAIQNTEFPIRKTEKGYESLTNLKVIAKAMEDYEGLKRNHSGVFDGEALFIYGGKSAVGVSEDKDLILQHFPNAQLHCVQHAGHEIYSQCPDEFLEEVLCFIGK